VLDVVFVLHLLVSVAVNLQCRIAINGDPVFARRELQFTFK